MIEGRYVLTNITIINGKNNRAKPDMFLKIHDGNIEEIGPMANYVPSASREVDMIGYYAMPGLIDAHIHLAGGRGCGLWGDTEILCEPKEVRAMRSVYEAQKMLKHGFTTLRDISWNGLYLKRIFHDKVMPGPKVIACGPGLARSGGHCDSPQLPLEFVKKNHFWAILSDGREECIKNVRRVLREGADQIKFWATGGGNWGTDRITDTHYSQEEMNAICEEAHRIAGTMVCAHCETEETIRMALKAGVDTIEHGEELNEKLAEEMSQKGVILVPTLYLLANWYDFVKTPGSDAPKLIRPDAFLYREADTLLTDQEKSRYHKQVIDSFHLALKKGVKIALGSDTVYEPACEYGEQSMQELKELIKQGMSVDQAIKSATEIAAQACGMAHRVGTIEPGKAADLLLFKENPVENIKMLTDKDNIEYVIVDGKLAVEHGKLAW